MRGSRISAKSLDQYMRNLRKAFRSVPGCSLRNACRLAGVPRSTVYVLMERDESFRQRVEMEIERSEDQLALLVNEFVLKPALNGDEAMLRYFLSKYGKSRGYW